MVPSSLRTRLLALLGSLFAVILAAGWGVVALWKGGPEEALGPSWLLPVVALAVLAGLLLVADRVVRRLVLGPLRRMAANARKIAEGDHERRIREEGPRELRDLAGSVNRMADRLLDDREKLAENVASLEEVNRALTQTRDELIQAEKLASVGRMAAGLAHEIGNPLNSVMTYLEVGRRQGARGEWMDGLDEEAARIDDIVRGLLDFARPGDATLGEHDANRIVEEALELLDAQGKLEGVEVETSLDPSLPGAWVSPTRLEQVLVNLLLNAVDAVHESGEPRVVTVRSRAGSYQGPPGLRVRARRSDDPEEVDYSHLRRFHSEPSPSVNHALEVGDRVVEVEVLDTGPGLGVDPPERVFDPFYTTKEPGRGTGLGLAVSARLVERMGGKLEARERTDAPGSCFRVLLATRRPSNESSGPSGTSGDTEEERA